MGFYYLAFENPAHFNEWSDISHEIVLDQTKDNGSRIPFRFLDSALDLESLSLFSEFRKLLVAGPIRMIFAPEGKSLHSPWQTFHCIQMQVERGYSFLDYQILESGEYEERDLI